MNCQVKIPKVAIISAILIAGLFVSAGQAHAGELINQFTVSLWVNAQSSVASRALVVKDNELRLVTDGSGNPLCQIHNGTAWQTAATSGTAITTGTWHYVSCTYDGANIKVYLDATATATQAETDSLQDAATNFKVGEDDSGTYSDLQGTVDDFKVYNYARTPAQITQDMNAGHPIGGSPIGSQVTQLKFDEQQGTTANDAVGANNGAISGATWKTRADCKLNGCLDYDGTDDVTTITNAASIDLNDNLAASFTMSAWIYPDTAGEGTGGQVFQKGANTWLRVDTLSGGKLDLEGSLDLATADATVNASAVITQSAWNHVAMSWTDDSDDEITLWVNGVAVATSTNGSGAPAADTANLLIGGTTTNNFDGKIDEVKIYSTELTIGQMALDRNFGSSVAYSVGTDEAADLADGAGNPPIAEWNFDEKTGTSANDISGNGNTGTLTNGPTWVSVTGAPPNANGLAGGALEFDGVNDYVEKSLSTSIAPNDIYTITAWVKTSVNKQAQEVVSWGNDTTGERRSLLLWHGSNCSTCEQKVYSSTWASNIGGTTQINDGNWHHIAITVNGGEAKIYANGILENTGTNTLNAYTNNNVRVGASPSGVSAEYFDGLIDNVRIYNYARTPAQIAYDYNRGRPIAHWRLDECSGTTANDASGNSNDGTITIGATGSQTSAGTCNSGTASEAWNNGTTGKLNASLKFDGTDDEISVTDTSSLRFDAGTLDFSLFAWVKRSASGATHYVISKEDADNDGYRLLLTSSNTVQCSVDTVDVTSSSTITDSNWHHIGCTIDRDGNGQVYVDGIADGTATAISSEAMATTADIHLGTRAYTSTNYMNGQIDDVRIYNYALSPLQVKKLLNENSSVRFGPATGSP